MNYEEKDWPSLPEDMIPELISYALAAETIGGKSASPSYNGVESVYGIVAAPDYLRDWVKDNLLLSDDYFIGLQRFTYIFKTPIHKDSIRTYCYNNVLTENSPTTSFYDDDMNMVEKVQYRQNSWYYHNTDVFHKVSEMQGARVAVTIFKPVVSRTGEKYELAEEGRSFLNAI